MRALAVLTLVLSALPLAAQPAAGPVRASAEDRSFEEFEAEFGPPPGKVFDPLEPYNRFMFGFNDRFYFWLWRPAARGWAFVAPEPLRVGINNAFANITFPIRFVNALAQLKPGKAGRELRRFLVNSSLGVAGLFDPAAGWLGWQPPPPEDFGQTMARYGVGGGFPLVLPLLGPMNLRDAVATIPDGFLTPYYHFTDTREGLALRAAELFNRSSLHLGEYESLKQNALDPYTFFRDAYRQNRIKEVSE